MYKKLLTLFFSILLLVTPLLFTTKTYEAFEFPKMMLVYFLGSTIIWIFLIKKIWAKEKIKLPNTWVLVFLGLYIISTIFSSHFNTSLFGYYTRFNGSLISVIILVGLHTVLINEYRSSEIKGLIKLACLPVIPIALYAIYQHIHTDPRVYSTLGQPNWLAAYLAFLLPITLNQTLQNPFYKKVGWGMLFLLGFFGLWVTYSLSGFLALLSGFAVFLYLNWKKVKQNKSWLSLITFLALFIAVINPGIFAQKIGDIYIDVSKFFIAQAQQQALQNNISDPGFIRLNLWKSSLNLAVSSIKTFLIGTGPETFPYAFQEFRSANLNFSSEWDVVFNKPHNYYLELLTNLGILGLISYSLIISKFFTKRKTFVLPSIVAFLVANIFGWPTVTTALIFWVMLSYEYK